jgi:hypothetical protein
VWSGVLEEEEENKISVVVGSAPPSTVCFAEPGGLDGGRSTSTAQHSTAVRVLASCRAPAPGYVAVVLAAQRIVR